MLQNKRYDDAERKKGLRKYGDYIGMAIEAKDYNGYGKQGIKAPIEELDVIPVPPVCSNLRAADHHDYCCVDEAYDLSRHSSCSIRGQRKA